MQDHSTRDPEAYDLYLRGVAFMHQGGAHGAVRGAELLRAAVTRDPGFVRAWLSFAGMSRARLVFAPEHAARAVQDIEEACNKLLALAPQLWTAHLAQSWLLNMRRDWLGVEHALDKAAALAPGRPWELQLNRGIFYAQVHNVPAAIELFQAAARSNPLGLIDSGVLQMQLIIAGRHEEAEIEYRRSLDLAGDREMVEHLVLHRLWAQKKPFRQQFRRYLDLTQTKPAPVLEEVYTVADEPARALEKLRNAAAAAEYQNAPRQLVLAWWMANYGDAEAAFAGAWRAYVEMSYVHLAWLWFPVFACVRDHARFPDLLERVGLAEYQRAKNR